MTGVLWRALIKVWLLVSEVAEWAMSMCVTCRLAAVFATQVLELLKAVVPHGDDVVDVLPAETKMSQSFLRCGVVRCRRDVAPHEVHGMNSASYVSRYRLS